MDPTRQIEQLVERFAVIVMIGAFLISLGVLPAGSLEVVTGFFVNRVTKASIYAMFATVLGAGVFAKIVSKLFRWEVT